ncbi:MAG: arginine N-succinyltransferase [Phycisphaerales bacterium]
MFLIRRTTPDDIDVLFKLAKMVFFINLPADKEIIGDKIRRSRQSFQAAAQGTIPKFAQGVDKSATALSPVYMFSIVDTSTGNCYGTSSVIGEMGSEANPNISLKLEREEFFSKDLQSGTTQVTAQLMLDTSGPSEIGGLIVGPSSRRHPQKLGKQLSLIRFHYIGLYRKLFADMLLAEMMAPIAPDGGCAFWDAFPRRFINLSYQEADRFCQHSREFMTSLLPREKVYLALLSPEARASVGQVGADTVPARRMLEGIGFKDTGRVDPFDGGPHLQAVTDEVEIVKNTGWRTFKGVCQANQADEVGFVSVATEDGDFRAVYTTFKRTEKSILLPRKSADALRAEEGWKLGVTPLDLGIKGVSPKGATAGRTAKKPAKKKSKKKTTKKNA